MPNAQNTQDQLATISQAQKERLFHIDFKLFFLGSVNRTDLVSRFGIKEAAASRDLSLYKELAPKNIEYDTKAKTYIQRESFTPLFEYSGSQTLAALLHGFVMTLSEHKNQSLPAKHQLSLTTLIFIFWPVLLEQFTTAKF